MRFSLSHRSWFLSALLLSLFGEPQVLLGQISSIQRITYGYPLIDSLPKNQFPRGGSYTAIIQGSGLAKVIGFAASDPNVTGTVSAASDTSVTVQLSSTAVMENDTADAPIPGVSFGLLAPSGLISSPVTFDIVTGPPTQITSFAVSNGVKWIPAGVPTIVTYSVTALWAGNNQEWYIGCGQCEGSFGTFTGDQFSVSFSCTTVVTVTSTTDTTFTVVVGGVDGSGQGGTSGNAPLSPKTLTIPVVQMQFVDPVTGSASTTLLSGPAVTSDRAQLSDQARGSVVKGVAADGVSQLVIRITGAPPNESFSLSLVQDGGLAEIGSTDFQPSIASLQADSSGNAFVLYRAPDDFAQTGTLADAGASSRTVDLNYRSTDNPGVLGDTAIEIVRPPVLLIHGIWGSPGDFTNLIADLNALAGGDGLPFQTFPIAYNFPLPTVTAANPPLSASELAVAQTVNTVSSLGFSVNEGIVLPQIYQYILSFKQTNNVAAVSADIVAHSMGGVITRGLPRLQGAYFSDGTYGEGPVHKLITIDTPHLGTPLANDLLSTGGAPGDNSCVRELFAASGMLAASSVSLANFGTAAVTAAVGDLEGDGFGGSLSPALAAVRSGAPTMPTAFIAGNGCGGLNCGMTLTFSRLILQSWCGTIKNNPLANALDPVDWPRLFRQDSDAIVPLQSQTNAMSSAALFPTSHSKGTQTLGFSAPDALSDLGVGTAVLQLLNTPRTTTPTFTWLY